MCYHKRNCWRNSSEAVLNPDLVIFVSGVGCGKRIVSSIGHNCSRISRNGAAQEQHQKNA